MLFKNTFIFLCLASVTPNLCATTIDLTRPPDYKQMARLTGNEKLAALRDQLGDVLAANWKPASSGRTGSSSQENFSRWVDLYQWLDLLESSEPMVMKQWLAHHLIVTEQQSGQGSTLHVVMCQPGVSLSPQPVSALLLEKITSDKGLMAQMMKKLVEQPFTSATGMLADRLDPAFIAETLADPSFLKRWSESFSQDDVAPKVLLNLQAIWRAHSADWYEFQALALALAVVKDQPAPDYWPHRQVDSSEVPRKEGKSEELFAQWVDSFREGKLRMDPRQLEVGDLKFVIDAPLESSEFASIRNNPTLAHQDPAKAFESIAYDHGRMIKNVFDWPWGKYDLTAIKKHGGICVDQAYYAAVAGKSLGIPTIFFSGQGKDGGHAWIGYLKGPHNWDLNVARYASQNYATGEGLDPQSWTPISDHDLELITRHLGNQDAQNAARRDSVMASDFRRKGDIAREGCALQSALQACPENPSFWDAREEWLIRSGASLTEIKEHHQAAISQFSRFSDLKTRHQQALVDLAMHTGNKSDAAELSQEIVNENRGNNARTDLGATAAWTMISGHLQAKDFPKVVEEFERQLHLQGASGGGNFFYKVVAPLSIELLKSGRQELALRVLKESNQTLRPDRDSILDHDLRKLWKEAGGSF